MFSFSRIRRYFWTKEVCRLAGQEKLDGAQLRRLSDEHLFAVVNIARRVKRLNEPRLLPLAIQLTLSQSEAAGYLFCATGTQIRETLSALSREIQQREADLRMRPIYRSSAPYSHGAGLEE